MSEIADARRFSAEREVRRVVLRWFEHRMQVLEKREIDDKARRWQRDVQRKGDEARKLLLRLQTIAAEVVRERSALAKVCKQLESLLKTFAEGQQWSTLPQSARPAHRPKADPFLFTELTLVMGRHPLEVSGVARIVVDMLPLEVLREVFGDYRSKSAQEKHLRDRLRQHGKKSLGAR